MPYHSLNPITASLSTPYPFLPVEIEVFIEKANEDDVFVSLGVFSLTSDSEGIIIEQIQSLLHAALMDEVSLSIPSISIEAELVLGVCRKYKYRHRYYYLGSWSSWTDVAEDFVVLGGEAHEEYDNQFNAAASISPFFLTPEQSGLSVSIAQGYIDVLCHTSGTLTITHIYFSQDELSSTPVVTTFKTFRSFRVVRIPVVPPPITSSPTFIVTVEMAAAARSFTFVCDFKFRHRKNNFCWLNSRGGWSFLETNTGQTSTLEVTQSQAERFVPHAYYDNADPSATVIWKTRGTKRTKTATGFWPSEYLDVLIQDFMLSPLRFLWSVDLQRWVPILVNSRSVTYRDEQGGNLRSYVFEYSPAFDSNLPSAL